MSTVAAVKPSLTIKRRFNAAPEKVFAAWTDPEKIKRWMSPGEAKMLSAENDARAGGRFRWVMQAPDGEKHDVSGVYREVIPNEKLVFTWAWISTPERESLVTLTFKRDGDGTLFTMVHEQFFDETARDRHQHGWSGAMEKLEKYLAL
ncbi:MAG: SRPBCC domain-containing protein [Rhizobiales bacterium]|nr:SRPBCC domain-containing protein [Hyphomicrobiales bacterium]